uniref:Peptidase A1 domain-containing protein n=1 Tax=Steinernema glaseri TaxID=37863 RepID=A0A1I7YDJ7_9BILA
MLKWLVFLALVLLCSSFATKQNSRHKANVRVNAKRSLPKKAQEAIYHHPVEDYWLLSTSLFIGREEPVLGGFDLDILSGDLELYLCPSTNVTDSMKPCYEYQYSPTYINIDEHTAMESFKGVNADDKYMYNLTFVKSTQQRGSNIGLGWPALRKYPQDTFYLDAYCHQKPCLRRWRMTLARDGCEGGFTWGAICDEWMEYPTYMVPATSKRYWQFALSGFSIGNLTTQFDAQGVITTSSGYIGMPKKYLNMVIDKIGAKWEDEYGGYTVWCYDPLPDFELQLDNVVLKIQPELYVYTWKPLPSGKCIVNFEDSKANGFGPDWYFGLPLFASYCVGFDFDFGMLSFLYNDWVAGDSSCHNG